MKLKHFILTIGALSSMLGAHAQDTLRYSLEQTLSYGLTHRWDMRNALTQQSIASQRYDEVRTRTLPKLDLSADTRYFLQLQRTLLPGEFFTQPGQPTAEDQVIALGAKSNISGSLTLSQSIFDPLLKPDREQAALQQSRDAIQTEQVRLEAAYQITLAYYDVLLQQERVKFAIEALDRAGRLQQVAVVRQTNGAIRTSELDRIKLDVVTARAALEREQRNLTIRLDALAYQAGLPTDSLVLPATRLSELSPASGGILLETDPSVLPSFKLEEKQLQINQVAWFREKRTALPVVSATAFYGVLHLSNAYNLFSENTWFPYSYVGLQLSLPLYDGGLRKTRTESARLNMELNRTNLGQIRSQFEVQIRERVMALQTADEALQTAAEQVKAAQSLLKEDEVRFTEGNLIESDLRSTRLSYQEAENLYLTAVYDYLLALASYQRTAGLLGK